MLHSQTAFILYYYCCCDHYSYCYYSYHDDDYYYSELIQAADAWIRVRYPGRAVGDPILLLGAVDAIARNLAFHAGNMGASHKTPGTPTQTTPEKSVRKGDPTLRNSYILWRPGCLVVAACWCLVGTGRWIIVMVEVRNERVNYQCWGLCTGELLWMPTASVRIIKYHLDHPEAET